MTETRVKSSVSSNFRRERESALYSSYMLLRGGQPRDRWAVSQLRRDGCPAKREPRQREPRRTGAPYCASRPPSYLSTPGHESGILVWELWEGVEGAYIGGVCKRNPGPVFQSYCCRDRPAAVCRARSADRDIEPGRQRVAPSTWPSVRQTACAVSGWQAWQVHPSLAGQPWSGQAKVVVPHDSDLRCVTSCSVHMCCSQTGGVRNSQDERLGLIGRPPFCPSRSGFLAPTPWRVGRVYCRCGALVILLVGRQSPRWQGLAYSSKAPETRFPLVGA